MVAETIVILSRVAHESILDPIVIDIAPYDGNLTHVYDFQEFFLFTRRFGQTESGFHITLKAQSLRYTITGNCETSIYLRRKLPTEH
jgi:hypothetical protein